DVQAARNSFGADIVMVLVDSGLVEGESAADISWSLDANMPDISQFAPWAYGVCGVQDANNKPDYFITHEVGHLMGAGHSNLLVGDPGPQLYQYSSAYHFTDNNGVKYHTVMGYSRTSSSDTGYEFYPAFSSAEFTTPAGIPLGDAMHDNTRTLRETCVAVSNFRGSSSANGNGANTNGNGANGNRTNTSSSAKFTSKTVVSCKVADSEGHVTGIAQITIAKTDKNGQSKVSAVFYGLDGKKKSAKAVKAAVSLLDGGPSVKDVSLAVSGETAPLVISVAESGSVTGTFGAYSVAKTTSVATLSSDPRFRILNMPATLDGMPVLNDVESNGKAYHLLPDGDGAGFSVTGKKWLFAKAAGVKYAKDKNTQQSKLIVDVGKDGSKTNLCGLKLSVTDKTGVFKGNFNVYVDAGTPEKPKVKKLSFKVSGVVVDGVGFGRASYKDTSVDVSL
ncbi:MAG: hypothetical protein IJU61_11580, partial [Victivallales bacterium]|nr:hypothetical protein [Victivallales bacterium]